MDTDAFVRDVLLSLLKYIPALKMRVVDMMNRRLEKKQAEQRSMNLEQIKLRLRRELLLLLEDAEPLFLIRRGKHTLCNLFRHAQDSVMKEQTWMINKAFHSRARILNDWYLTFWGRMRDHTNLLEEVDVEEFELLMKNLGMLKDSFYVLSKIDDWQDTLKNNVRLTYDAFFIQETAPFIKKALRELGETFLPMNKNLS